MNLNQYYEVYGRERAIHVINRSEVIPLGSQERINELIPFFRSPVLDVGCATGNDVDYFSRQFSEVNGCDVCEYAVMKAKELFPGHDFFVHDFSEKPLNKKYNTIYLFDVIEHVFDYNSFLRNIRDSLNERGKLIITTLNVCGLRSRIKLLRGNGSHLIQFNESGLQAHIRFFTVKTLKEVIEVNGFKVIKTAGYSSSPVKLPSNWCGSITVIAEKRVEGKQG